MALKLYSALIKKDKNDKIEDIALISEHFSLRAFFFHLPWFLCHKMWRVSAMVILAQFVFLRLVDFEIISNFDLVFIDLALLAAIGANANHLYGKYLRSKGYYLLGYVLAQNEEEARLKAMKILHHNSPELSFDEFSETIIDPQFYLKSVKMR